MQYAQRRSPSSNAIGIGLVVVLHLSVGYALLQTLRTLPTAPPPSHLIVRPIDEPKKVEPPLTAPPVTLETLKLDNLVVPVITVKTPPPEPLHQVTATPPNADTLPPRPAPVETAALPVDVRAGAKHLAGPSLAYPRRPSATGEEGWVEVQCDVDDMGGTSNCAMTDHKGSMAFVDATMDYVKAARYSPATHNGVPVAERGHRFHIDFKLSDK